MAVFTANGQEGQNFGAMCVLKPLTRYLVVRFRGLNAAGQRVLCVMLDFKVHTQLCTRLAGASFADHGEGGRCRLGHLFNVGLISHCLRQFGFQHGHIDHPVQGFNALRCGIKAQITALIALNLHLQNGGAGFAFGPATQIRQQLLGRHVQGIGAHITVPRLGRVSGTLVNQGHAQLLRRQQQGQAAAHNAGASNADVKRGGRVRHGVNCRSHSKTLAPDQLNAVLPLQCRQVVGRIHVNSVMHIGCGPRMKLGRVALPPFLATRQLGQICGAQALAILKEVGHDHVAQHHRIARLCRFARFCDLGLEHLRAKWRVFHSGHQVLKILRLEQGLVCKCHHQPIGRQTLCLGQTQVQRAVLTICRLGVQHAVEGLTPKGVGRG